jgi:hypothetical protein
MTPVKAPASHESIFDRTADYVSAAMGRPDNIVIWLVLVVGSRDRQSRLRLASHSGR